MGYSILIGEKKIRTEDHIAEAYVEKIELPEAPPDGNEGHSNERQPSYSAMQDFLNITGLQSLFDVLLEKHPGSVTLTKSHLIEIRIAINSRWDMFPEYHQERLRWFEFWIDYALKNCKNPIIKNS